MRTIILAAAVLASLTGCAGSIDLQETTRGSGLKLQTINAKRFNLQALAPPPGSYKHLRVYIEGDGHAWATGSQPSTDPTPHSSIMVTFAIQDRAPAAYLARPCQFVSSEGCGVALWTANRFSAPAINAMNSGLDELKRQFGVEVFELVGHSGGGAVALVLAGMRSDVGQVQTIAGNIDPIYWQAQKNLTPLVAPETPLQFSAKIRLIPQRHFIGLNDTVVPPAVAYSYVGKLHGECVSVVETSANHSTGFAQSWAQQSNQPIPCKGQ